MIGDGLSGLGAALKAMAKRGITMRYGRVARVVADGDPVLTQSDGDFAGKHTELMDLFRLEAGRIVEHWDVIEDISGAPDHGRDVF